MPEDPNPATGKLAMDKAGLEQFLTNRVLPFKEEVRKIGVDDDTFGPTMSTVLGDGDIDSDAELETYATGKPLAIGFMAQPANLGGKGKALNTGILKTAKSLVTIYKQQTTLFGDIESDLRETIETLSRTQGANLLTLDGKRFLDIFEDTADDLGGTQGGGNSGGNGGGDDDS
ncbi:type VII secretion system-associated protein [Streptomyces sp. NBC_00879]|uniref:type VII secretion system-associated protein n=1 Tax=unclassified Streptomyces TaxID=2593676 RepID=UPI0038705391|nr:type VII secretion system-associated protein [Streptomyces sp. NBC_00885]WSY73272.1 type VII secretion system-associated protein [Streptomyces sp. NBC_00879]